MNIAQKKMDEINEEYRAIREAKHFGEEQIVGTHKLRVADGFDTSIFAKNWQICKLEDLKDMIAELTDMKQAIENVTGIC